MRVVTDSTPVDDPKNPDTCNVFALLRLVAPDSELKEWEEKYRKGGIGYGTVKKRIVELLIEYFRPYRARRQELEKNRDQVEKIQLDGAEMANAVAQKR